MRTAKRSYRTIYCTLRGDEVLDLSLMQAMCQRAVCSLVSSPCMDGLKASKHWEQKAAANHAS